MPHMANRTLTKAILQLIRLPNGFSAIGNIVAAFFIATQGHGDIAELLTLIAISLCFFHGGMVLNDCFDLNEDRRERPERPLPSGQLSVKWAFVGGAGLLLTGLALSLSLGMQSFYIALALAINVVAYDAIRHQGFVAAGLMGSCRYLNWLLGLSIIELNALWALLPLPVFAYIFGLTLLSQQETCATNPKRLLTVAAVMTVVMLLLVTLWFGQTPHGYLFLAMTLSGWIILMLRLKQLYNDFTPGAVKGMVIMLLMGIIPFDALLLLAAGLPLAALALLLLMVPGKLIAKQLYMT
ncbi:hypothetical protein EXY25_09810 [Corallincola spongiicola]|uniref:Prenyltransferase n=2 Tax=Corallincola spongiicola TaxID=2520508 RepID=A0ABY1WS10_9GAMM|nr:hypothetical protein EXY25_09810 [Corallincola spongiicola]